MTHLILFDIDGTLVWGGPAKEAFLAAIDAAFGTVGPVGEVAFAGKTDPQIARALLNLAGLDDNQIDAGLPKLWERYPSELARRLPAKPVEALPGVPELLGALEAMPEVALGLVTGNIKQGAHLKLGSAGLAGSFRVGGFGCDHEHRNHLPGIAIQRAERTWGVPFHPEQVVVVGDTPRDVECGRYHGTRTFAVATGHFDLEALEATGADHVSPDLTSTEEVVSALLDRGTLPDSRRRT